MAQSRKIGPNLETRQLRLTFYMPFTWGFLHLKCNCLEVLKSGFLHKLSELTRRIFSASGSPPPPLFLKITQTYHELPTQSPIFLNPDFFFEKFTFYQLLNYLRTFYEMFFCQVRMEKEDWVDFTWMYVIENSLDRIIIESKLYVSWPFFVDLWSHRWSAIYCPSRDNSENINES